MEIEKEPQGILTTLYATRLLPKPLLAHLRAKQPVPVAVEFRRDVAEQLLKVLDERLKEEGSGAIRVTLLCDVNHV